ncbi:MAG: hypothetical protein ACKO5P_05825, partial [Nodosilinea sp.]
IAFEKVLGRKVQVSLEVLPDPKPEALVAPLRSPPDQAVPAASPPPPTDAAAIPPPPVIPGPAGAEPRPTPSPTLEITTDFDRAVKTFAQFFNGQVVDLGDDLNWLTEGPLQPSEAGARQPSHPDKDVPF